MNDAALVGDFKRLGDLPGNRQRFIERNWAGSNAIGERWAFDEFHHQRANAIGLFKPIDRGNVRMVERREHLGFA